MRKSKLLLLLESLTSIERKRLEQFIKSPYSESNNHSILLLESIIPYYPKFTSVKLSKEKVFDQIFPGEKYNDLKLRKAFTKLVKIIEHFLSIEELRQEKRIHKRLLIKSLSRRNLYDLFDKEVKNQISQRKKNQEVSPEHHFELMSLNQELFLHPSTKKLQPNNKSFKELTSNLDSYYVLKKFRYICEALNREKALAESTDITHFVPEVQSIAERRFKSNHPLFSVYSGLLDLLRQKNSNEGAFDNVFNLFKKSTPRISKREQQIILSLLINNALQAINSGNISYADKSLNLYKFGLETNILTTQNQITDITFTNIIVISSGLKKFKWAIEFIDQYRHLLNKDIRKVATKFAKSFLYFNQEKYNEAIELLDWLFTQPDTITSDYKLRIRSLYLRCYYEFYLRDSTQFSLLQSYTISFERYITRENNFSKDKLIAYKKFIMLVRKLVKLIERKKLNIKNLEQLLHQVEKEDRVMARDWLIQKIKALA